MTPTPRELAALRAVVECGSERAAADQLRITEHAVHKRIGSLKARLGGCSTIAQAFALSVQQGWVDPASVSVPTYLDR